MSLTLNHKGRVRSHRVDLFTMEIRSFVRTRAFPQMGERVFDVLGIQIPDYPREIRTSDGGDSPFG